MSYSVVKKSGQKFLPTLRAMTPYEVYLNQVRSAIDPIRAQRKGLTYLPPQLGGLEGQRKVLEQSLVIQVIDFEVD